MKNKLIAIQCLSLCDIGMAVYTYFALSNFDEFKKIVVLSTGVDSPDIQLELYKLFLQTLTFISIFLVIIHLIIYYFFYKEKKFAKAYVKYYSILASLSLLVSAFFMGQYTLLLPAGIYVLGLYNALKFDPLTNSKTKTAV